MIDSPEKRRSLSGLLPIFPPGVTPSASQDQEWRQEAGYGYPGILAGSPVVLVDDFVGGTVSVRPAVGGTIDLRPAVGGSVFVNRGG
jgi:hypothetical protein